MIEELGKSVFVAAQERRNLREFMSQVKIENPSALGELLLQSDAEIPQAGTFPAIGRKLNVLLPRHSTTFGYSRLSLCRALSVVNCQSTPV